MKKNIRLAGAVAFRRNRIKTGGIVQQSTVPLSCFMVFLWIKVENLRFSPFFISFYSTAVSSLAVFIYSCRSENDAFRSKSVRPTGVFSLRIS